MKGFVLLCRQISLQLISFALQSLVLFLYFLADDGKSGGGAGLELLIVGSGFVYDLCKVEKLHRLPMFEFAEAVGAEEPIVEDEIVDGLLVALLAAYFVELLLN